MARTYTYMTLFFCKSNFIRLYIPSKIYDNCHSALITCTDDSLAGLFTYPRYFRLLKPELPRAITSEQQAWMLFLAATTSMQAAGACPQAYFLLYSISSLYMRHFESKRMINQRALYNILNFMLFLVKSKCISFQKLCLYFAFGNEEKG